MRWLALTILALGLLSCGSTTAVPRDPIPAVREPSAHERAGIAAEAKATYRYEADVTSYDARLLHVRSSHLRPKVVAIRVSVAQPEFASALVELADRRGRRRPGAAVVVLRKVEDKELARDIGPWGSVGAAITYPLSCTNATPSGFRTLVCPDPWPVLGRPPPRVPIDTGSDMTRVSPDLHALDWKDSVLPGAACNATRPIRLRHGIGYTRSAVEPWWAVVEADAGRVTYGDLDGDGRDEAAVTVTCGNGGGTAAGDLSSASLVFRQRRGSLDLIGIVTPRQPFASDAHPPLVGMLQIRHGSIASREAWYGPNDGDCCPSGRATTTWTYAGGKLRPSRTVVDRPPRR